MHIEGDQQHQLVAHGLVERDGKILVLRRRDGRYLGGQWDIPGGTVEAGETPEEASVRECLEETGLRARVTEQLSHVENLDTEGRDITFHTLTFRLALDDADAAVVLSPTEHDDFRWASHQEAADLPLVWHVRRTLALI